MTTTPRINLICETCGARATVPEVVPVSGLFVVDRTDIQVGMKPTIHCIGSNHARHPAREMARA